MSGKVHEPSSRLGLGLLFAPLVVPATLVLALAYGHASVHVPLQLSVPGAKGVKLVSIVLLGVYTVAIAMAVNQVREWGKVQSRGFMRALAPAAGLFALHAAWASYAAAMLAEHGRPGEPAPGFLDLLLRPDLVWQVARSIATQRGRADVLLWALWAIEAAVIVGGTTAMVVMTVHDPVFCEDCQAWCHGQARMPYFAMPDDPAVLRPAIDGDPAGVDALAALARPSDETTRFLSVELHRCPVCKQFATSVLRVEELGKRKTDLSPRYVVDPATYERLAGLVRPTT